MSHINTSNTAQAEKPKLTWYQKRTPEQRKHHNEYCKRWKQAKRDANTLFVIEDI